jgi:hypothetical protein
MGSRGILPAARWGWFVGVAAGWVSLVFGFWTLVFGLSLICYWSICVAPVRGSTHFSLPPQRKVSKRKRAQTASQ